MQMIQWAGESIHWGTPPRSDRPKFLFPLVEESVLEVAFSDSPLRKLPKAAAIACTSRLAQRALIELHCPELNPWWEPWRFRAAVVKAPASTQNEGVRFFTQRIEMVDLLERYAPGFAHAGVVEQFLNGDAYEIDGVVFGPDHFYFFNALRQTWAGDAIAHYGGVDDHGITTQLRRVAQQVVQAVGLRDCPFCCEFRLIGNLWKLVEVQARIGEDRREYRELLCRGDAIAVAERWSHEYLESAL